MDLTDIKQHELIIERCMYLKEVMHGVDGISFIDEILEKSKSIIDEYNKLNLVVANPTKREKGDWTTTLKNFIASQYGRSEFVYNLIDKTIFSKYVFDMWLLLRRKSKGEYISQKEPEGKLRHVLLVTIRNSVLKEFTEQNNELAQIL